GITAGVDVRGSSWLCRRTAPGPRHKPIFESLIVYVGSIRRRRMHPPPAPQWSWFRARDCPPHCRITMEGACMTDVADWLPAPLRRLRRPRRLLANPVYSVVLTILRRNSFCAGKQLAEKRRFREFTDEGGRAFIPCEERRKLS